MAESNEPTDPAVAGEKPETEKPATVAGPTDSAEDKPAATTGEEAAHGAVSAEAGQKPAAAEAKPEAKPAKKAPKKKKEEPAPVAAAAPESLSLSADVVGKQKIVKAKGSKNVHSGIAHRSASKARAKAQHTQRRWSRRMLPGRQWVMD